MPDQHPDHNPDQPEQHPKTPEQPTPSPDSERSPQKPDAQADAEETPAHLDHWSPVTEAMRQHHDPLVTKRGNPLDPPDPGTPLSRLIAIVCTCLVVIFVVTWQNTPDEVKEKIIYGKVTAATPEAPKPDDPAPGQWGQVDLMGRIFLRGYEQLGDYPLMEQLDPGNIAHTDEDRVRLVMLAGEFEDDADAIDRIIALRRDIAARLDENGEPVAPDELILRDLAALETIYTEGIDLIEPEQQLQLGMRYGYIGKVALTHGLPESDPARQELTSGFMLLGLFLLVTALIVILGPLVGLIVLIVGIVYFATGRLKMRCRVPAPGGSVFLETYALFVGGFIALSTATFFVAHSSSPELAAFSVLVQWLLLLTVLWGLIRRMPSAQWRQAIGWHTGEGVIKEISCGVLAYIASIPVYIIGAIITAILLIIQEMLRTRANGGVPPEPEPMVNPIFELVASGDLFFVLFLFVLATTWAPIVEESIFRGALYRHLRGRLHWVASGLISAVLFAFMHDYGPLMVAPLIALGFMFAFMREWRGSIIAPMTAHFIHNFTLMAMMITFVQLMKDPV